MFLRVFRVCSTFAKPDFLECVWPHESSNTWGQRQEHPHWPNRQAKNKCVEFSVVDFSSQCCDFKNQLHTTMQNFYLTSDRLIVPFIEDQYRPGFNLPSVATIAISLWLLLVNTIINLPGGQINNPFIGKDIVLFLICTVFLVWKSWGKGIELSSDLTCNAKSHWYLGHQPEGLVVCAHILT